MEKLFLALIIFSTSIFSQNFEVEKVTGTVKYLKGTGDNWETVTKGTELNANDFLETEENSFIQLNKDGKRFLLKSSSALGLNYIKEISLNDLLLALAMEEIRNVPKKKNDSNLSNTAVYGSKVTDQKVTPNDLDLGIKRLNGAKQLNEYGYDESAVIAAKETYRNYPSTKKLIEDRLYFADILINLELYEEALTELNDINNYAMNNSDKEIISQKISKVKAKILR